MLTVSPTLEIEMNAETGSVFYKTHRNDDFDGSLRFWIASDVEPVALNFRLRITPRMEVLNFKHYVETAFPGVVFTGMGAGHASIAGMVAFKEGHHQDAVLAQLGEHGVAGQLSKLFSGLLPGLPCLLSETDFAQFLYEQVALALGSSTLKKGPAVILGFGTMSKALPEEPAKAAPSVVAQNPIQPHPVTP